MNTREILSIVALAALGLCLLSGLVKMAMKGPKAKQSCDHACSLLVFVAIVLLGVSQLLEEEGYKELDLPFWEPGVGALPWTFSGEGKMKGNKASMGVTGPTPTFGPQDTYCKHHVNLGSYCMKWKAKPVCHGEGAIPCPKPTPAPPAPPTPPPRPNCGVKPDAPNCRCPKCSDLPGSHNVWPWAGCNVTCGASKTKHGVKTCCYD